MHNINAYNEALFKEEFPTTHYYKIIKELYPTVGISYDYFGHEVQTDVLSKGVLREVLLLQHNTISAVPFYYLKYLDPDITVYDLGCGYNFFKPFFKNLIGVDPYHERADICEIVGPTYYKEHVSYFDALISINALHFVPINTIRKVCEDFTLMLKPNSTGFITLNIDRMLMAKGRQWSPFSVSDGKDIIQYDNNSDRNFLESWIRKQFDNFPHELKVFDLNLSKINGVLNGNLRLVVTRSS